MNLGWSLPPKEGTKLTQDNRWVLLPSAANSGGCSIPESSPHNSTGHQAKLVCSSPPQREHTEFNPSSGWMPALTCLRPQLFHDRLRHKQKAPQIVLSKVTELVGRGLFADYDAGYWGLACHSSVGWVRGWVKYSGLNLTKCELAMKATVIFPSIPSDHVKRNGNTRDK